MNQIETINYLSQNLSKVIASHGADSDYSSQAFYQLQAAKMGLTGSAIYEWANSEMERLKQISLDNV